MDLVKPLSLDSLSTPNIIPFKNNKPPVKYCVSSLSVCSNTSCRHFITDDILEAEIQKREAINVSHKLNENNNCEQFLKRDKNDKAFKKT